MRLIRQKRQKHLSFVTCSFEQTSRRLESPWTVVPFTEGEFYRRMVEKAFLGSLRATNLPDEITGCQVLASDAYTNPLL